MTQKETVIKRLQVYGYITNFWAIKNYILRLASIISQLKNEGYSFERKYGFGKNKKNSYYFIRTKNLK